VKKMLTALMARLSVGGQSKASPPNAGSMA